jgi:hypothetical protein
MTVGLQIDSFLKSRTGVLAVALMAPARREYTMLRTATAVAAIVLTATPVTAEDYRHHRSLKALTELYADWQAERPDRKACLAHKEYNGEEMARCLFLADIVGDGTLPRSNTSGGP